MSDVSSIQPALDAIGRLRKEISKRIGTAGGNLNQRLLSDLTTLEVVIRQVQSLNDVVNMLNQQAQLASFQYRTMTNQLAAMQESRNALPNDDHDDEDTDTKGK